MKLNDYHREILILSADGLTIKEIAGQKKVKPRVIDSVLSYLRFKHECPNTTSLVAKAFREKQIA